MSIRAQQRMCRRCCLIAEAAVYLLALYEGLNIRLEFSDNLKGGQI